MLRRLATCVLPLHARQPVAAEAWHLAVVDSSSSAFLCAATWASSQCKKAERKLQTLLPAAAPFSPKALERVSLSPRQSQAYQQQLLASYGAGKQDSDSAADLHDSLLSIAQQAQQVPSARALVAEPATGPGRNGSAAAVQQPAPAGKAAAAPRRRSRASAGSAKAKLERQWLAEQAGEAGAAAQYATAGAGLRSL